MKPISVNINGIQFRSKLEARWYYFMGDHAYDIVEGKHVKGPFDWPIEYEPDLHDVGGYMPDFIIFGDVKKILVEVKPISYIKDFYEPEYKEFREKVKRANIFEKGYHLIIVGNRIDLTPREKYYTFGIHLTENSHLDMFKYPAIFTYNGDTGARGILNPLKFKKWLNVKDLSYELRHSSAYELKKEFGHEKFCVEDLVQDTSSKFNVPIENYCKDEFDELYKKGEIKDKWNGAGSLLQWKPPIKEVI